MKGTPEGGATDVRREQAQVQGLTHIGIDEDGPRTAAGHGLMERVAHVRGNEHVVAGADLERTQGQLVGSTMLGLAMPGAAAPCCCANAGWLALTPRLASRMMPGTRWLRMYRSFVCQ